MPLTRDFRETVIADIRQNPGFRNEMLVGALEELLAGDLAVAREALRDLINATLGFEALSREVDIPVKSLMRMLGPNGNPQAKNLFAVIAALQRHERVTIRVTAAPASPRYRQQRESRAAGFAEPARKFRHQRRPPRK